MANDSEQKGQALGFGVEAFRSGVSQFDLLQGAGLSGRELALALKTEKGLVADLLGVIGVSF